MPAADTLQVMRKPLVLLTCLIAFMSCLAGAADLVRKTIAVSGIQRAYTIYMPDSTEKPPLVFVFHGHGGNMRNTARTFAIHKHWPETCVVYMQGLKTPGQLTDPEGKRTGWQAGPGDQDNRDLAFFDAVYAALADKVDQRNVFSTGHSNGGGFTYLLMQSRGDKLRAAAPSSAAANKLFRQKARFAPIPLIHYAAKNDPLVKYLWQQATLRALHRINQCERQGKPWHNMGGIEGTLYPSASGNPIVTLISDGDHKFPPEAARLFVMFFKEQLDKPEPACEESTGVQQQPEPGKS